MADKYPLDDEDLDKVSGGAFANTACTCSNCAPKNTDLPNSCDNCSHMVNGYCPYK